MDNWAFNLWENKMKSKKVLRKCEQTKCGYLNNGCKECEGCKAKSSIVNEACEICWACENREGMLRWKDDDLQKQQEKEKAFIEVLKEVKKLHSAKKLLNEIKAMEIKA